jgi:hypothetical protein
MKGLVIAFFAVLMLLASPAGAQTFTRPAFARSDGEKKVGQYVWVWRSGTISSSQGSEIEADCPLNRVVLGGGYALKSGFLYEVVATRPNAAFDGWVLIAIPGYSAPAVVTVYAVCAPPS